MSKQNRTEQDKLEQEKSEHERSEHEKSELEKSEQDRCEQDRLDNKKSAPKRCPQCAAEVDDAANTCPLCEAELLGTFALNQDLVEESVENLLTLLRAEFDLKSLRLAEDTDQLMARSKIREMVREDAAPLTIFERGVVLQHLLNIIFNSRDEENL